MFADYRQQNRLAKDDPEARKRAVTPLYIQAGEEILARTQLAATTSAGFRERWTLFWANHFTMAARGLPETVAVGPFEREAIRPHVFGRFEDLLATASSHPGMLLYLDQTQSIGPNSPVGIKRAGKVGLNENLGREILELHTCRRRRRLYPGRRHRVRPRPHRLVHGPRRGRRPSRRAPSSTAPTSMSPARRTIMGRTYPDTGRDQALAVLRDLAASPHTADHLARQDRRPLRGR